MAYAQIANILPQYENYPNYWLKAYSAGTTTPILMADDNVPTTTFAKLEVNNDGFLRTAGNALIIPYIDETYDLWLFPTEAEADANDTGNAIQVADAINPTPWDTGAELTTPPTINGDELYYITNIREAYVDINNQVGTTYTPILSDRNGVITCNNAAAITVTIPPESSVNYPVGTALSFLQLGAGQVTLAAGVGVTLNSENGLNINAQYGFSTALKIASDSWVITGSMTS